MIEMSALQEAIIANHKRARRKYFCSVEMVLKFSLDPETGVVKPPVTVFNGGKRKTRKTRKTKTRKTRKTKKGKKTYRRSR